MKYKLLVLLILIAAIGLTQYKFNSVNVKKLWINEVFPMQIKNWHGKDEKVAENVYKLIPKKELLSRVYTNDKTHKKVYISIVLTNDRETIHDPQICYRGQGIEMTRQKVIMLSQKNEARYVYGIKKEEPYTIIYWYTDLNKTFSGRVNFMREITMSKFWNKPLKGFGLVILMAPHSLEKDVIDLSEDVNKILLNQGSI